MIQLLLNNLLTSSLFKFALTGVLNTVVGLGIIYALKWFWAVPDTPANVVGYVVGFILSTVVNARWTFQYKQALAPVVPRYAALILVAYFVNLATVHFCIQVLHLNSYLAQAAGVVPYATITYIGSRWLIFRNKG